VNHLNWFWIGVMLTVPPMAGLAVAFLIWRGAKDTIIGNIVGAGVIFAGVVYLISREFAELSQLSQACLDAGQVCWATPSGFVRYGIYASIGLIEIAVLFTIGQSVEERKRRRDYSREWGGSR